MNIRDLEYLVAIDEEKSFVKAAKKCFISQPALSQQIKKIEDQLKILIFERDKKSIITTKKGQEVIKYAKEIISSSNAMQEINAKKDELKIALIPTICPYLLPHIVDSLNKKLPKIKFYFLELKTEELLEKLRNGEIDIGIIAHFANLIDDKLIYSKLFDEEFLLTLPKSSQLTTKDFPQILREKKLMLLEEGNCISDNIKDICSIHNKESFNDFYATNIETVKNMVRINNGVALLPKLACLKDSHLKFHSFKPKKFREIGLVNRASSGNSTLIRNIAEIIRNCVNKLI